jgi:endonuclease/exonuclease/phosphatase family metal-dependent hydrolase
MTQQRFADLRRGRRTSSPRRLVVLFSVTLIATFSIAASGTARAENGQGENGQGGVTAMSYNLFQGSELTEAISAKSPGELLAAVATDFGQVQASKFPERAQAIAKEVESTEPDLIGVQEAALWRTGAPSASFPPPPATSTAYDFVQILADALNAHGLHYAPVAVTTNFDIQAPGLFPFGFMNVRLTDRVAILARTDVGLTISNVKSANFTHNTVIPLFTGPFTVLGGWASVDATLGGKTTRFITTHLDPITAAARSAQASELVAGPLNTTTPVVLTCDCNSEPSTTAYATLRGAGLKDAWLQAQTGEPGFTCCQSTPTLLNPTSTLTSRIDYVFSRGGLKAGDAALVGAEQSSRTPAGLWPSDHAGVFAELDSQN